MWEFPIPDRSIVNNLQFDNLNVIPQVSSGAASFKQMEKILEHQSEDLLAVEKFHYDLNGQIHIAPNTALRDKRSSGFVVGVNQRNAEINGIRLEGTNVRLSNSQLYERKEPSSEGNFTGSNTVGVEKQSMQASEVVLRSVEGGFNNEKIIDYGGSPKDGQSLMAQKPTQVGKSHQQSEERSQVKKSHFKLPRTQEILHSTGNIVVPTAAPAQQNTIKSVISSGVGTGEVGMTNDDHESRELTEAEENVMRPINLLQEKPNNSARENQS